MTTRDAMQEKFDNLDDLNLTTNLLVIQENVLAWCKAKPDNEKLKEVRSAIIQISLLTNKLLLDRGNYHIALDQYRSRSTRSIQRARNADEEILRLEKELEIYKNKEKLGL